MNQMYQTSSTKGFDDFFSDIPIVNETVDFFGDTTDFINDPSAGDFFEIVTPAIAEDVFDGGGLDDFGFLPGPIPDIINGDGFSIPFGPTIGPNAPGPTPGVPPAAGMPGSNPGFDPANPSGGACGQEPSFDETPFFDDKKKACRDEAVILKSMETWIAEKENELDSVKARHCARQTRFNEECGDMDIDEEEDEKPTATNPTAGASPSGGCGCGCTDTGTQTTGTGTSTGTQTPKPCGCHAGTQTTGTGTASTGTQTSKPKPKSSCNAGTQTTKTKRTVRCTQAVIDKCCPGPSMPKKRKAKDDANTAPKKKAKPSKVPPKRKESTPRGRPCDPKPKKKARK